nr:MAG TPA: hypothetical protein [Caudoviricetes sp.]
MKSGENKRKTEIIGDNHGIIGYNRVKLVLCIGLDHATI